MIEDMTIRKSAPKTQHDYVQRVKNFAAFLGRSPDTASFEDVRRYQLHLAASGVGVPTINQTVSTLRFFFRVTLKRHEIVEHTHVIHEPCKLPVVLSPDEVARLLDAAPGLKYKAALSVAYGAGLRATGGRLRTSGAVAANMAAALGLGIAFGPLWQVKTLVERGEVELILRRFEPSAIPINSVWPATKVLP